MGQTVWQDWEMYVNTWNRAWFRRSSEPAPPPSLYGYFGKDDWGREVFFQPFPPYRSEERRKSACEVAQAQWTQWKAEEPKHLEEEARKRRELAEWRADFDRRLEAEREEKRRKKQAAKEESERKLSELAVRLAPKDAPKGKETRWPGHPRYWREFLAAPSCDRPPLASWDPANKTYTLPRGVPVPSIQDGWEEECKSYEALVLNRRSRNKTLKHA
jgi:hypothetical protein